MFFMGKKNKELQHNILSKVYFANIIVVLAIVAITFCIINLRYQSVKEEILFANYNLTNIISNRAKGIKSELNLLEKYLLRQDLEPKQILDFALDGRKKYDEFYFLTPEGDVVFSTQSEIKDDYLQFFKSKPWQNKAYVKDGFYYSKFDFSDITNPVRFIAKELDNGSILVAKVKFDFIYKYLAALNKNKDIQNLIIGLDGKILFHNDMKMVLQQKSIVDFYDLNSDYISTSSMQFSNIKDKFFDIFLTNVIEESGICVVTRYPVKNIVQSNLLIIVFIAFVIVAGILMIFVNAKFVKKQILRPVEVIRNIVKKIQRGETISQYADVGYISELGEISKNLVQIYNDINKKTISYQDYEQKFGYMFEQGPFIIFLINAKTGEFIDVSQRAIEFYGFSKVEFLQKSIYDLSDMGIDHTNYFEQKLQDGGVVYDIKHKLASGEIKDMRVNIKNININGDIKYGFCIVEDITQELLLIENLKKENEISVNSPVLKVVWSGGIFENVNFVSLNIKGILGYGIDEILNKKINFSELIHPDDFEAIKNEINVKSKIFSSNKSQKFQSLRSYRLIKRNGEVVSFNFLMRFIVDQDTNEGNIIGYFIDTDIVCKSITLKEDLGVLQNNLSFAWKIDCRGDIIECNRDFIDYIGVANGDLEYKISQFTRFIYKDDVEVFVNWYEHFKSGDFKNLSYEIRLVLPTGEPVWFSVTASISDDKSVINGIFESINYKKFAEKYNQITTNLFKHSGEAIALVGADGKIIDVNDMFCSITGYNKYEVIGKTPAIIKSGIHDASFYANMWKDLIKNGSWQGKIYNKRKNAEIYTEILTISTIYDVYGNIEYFLTIFSDISSAKAREIELERLAFYDVLTALPNRTFLEYKMQDDIKMQGKSDKFTGLVFIDIDDFKIINDLYGHKASDSFLIEFSYVIKSRLKDDDILVRFGGDKFAVLIKELNNKDEFYPILDALLKLSGQDILVGDKSIQANFSMGASIYSNGLNIEYMAILEQTNRMLYEAKMLGKNCYKVFGCDNGDFEDNYALADMVTNALENNDFLLLYQPIINVKSGNIVCLDSFVRWQNMPNMDSYDRLSQFILKYSIYDDVVIWNIKKALEDQSVLKIQYGLDIKFGVNISFEMLCKKDFFDKFVVIAATYENINMLELNIQGIKSSKVYEDSVNLLSGYTDFGVCIVLDDFESNQSALKILRNANVSSVKVSEELSLGVVSGADNLILLRSALSLCKTFSKYITAKGIETSETMYFLIKAGYENLQGGFIGGKMTLEQFRKWFSEYGVPDRFSNIKSFSEDEVIWSSLAVMHRIWIRSLLENLSASKFKNFKIDEFIKDYDSLMVLDYKKYTSDTKITIHIEITDTIMEILKGVKQKTDVSNLILELKAKRDRLLDLE